MACLHHPTAGLLFRISLFLLCFALATDYVRDVPMRQDDRHRLLATVRSIGAQVLGASLLGIGALDDNGIKHRLHLCDIVRVGAGDHQRQRDATPVHQHMPLARIFSPDPWGWGPQILVPAAT